MKAAYLQVINRKIYYIPRTLSQSRGCQCQSLEKGQLTGDPEAAKLAVLCLLVDGLTELCHISDYGPSHSLWVCSRISILEDTSSNSMIFLCFLSIYGLPKHPLSNLMLSCHLCVCISLQKTKSSHCVTVTYQCNKKPSGFVGLEQN